jgi:hypothetical protein
MGVDSIPSNMKVVFVPRSPGSIVAGVEDQVAIVPQVFAVITTI